MKKKLKYIFLFLSLLALIPVNLLSQDAAIISPYIQLQYFKNTDDQRILQTTLTYSKNRMELPLPGMEVSFFTGTDQKGIGCNRLLLMIKELPDLNLEMI